MSKVFETHAISDPHSELHFREIDPNEGDEVSTFILFHEYSFRDSSNAYVPDSLEERARLGRLLSEWLKNGEEKYHCLGVFSGGSMIANHYLVRKQIDGQSACHIHGLWVHPDFRKRGIARRLKEMGEDWARKKECRFMDTNVRVENLPMIGLNESVGYEIARLNFRKNLGFVDE